MSTTEQQQESAYVLYKRLLGYAWRYKGRFMLSAIFALVIAISFIAILVSLGSIANITFYQPDAVDKQGKPLDNPAVEMAEDIREKMDVLEEKIGWAPQGLDERFLALALKMQIDPMQSLKTACIIVVILAFFIGIIRFFQEYYAGAIAAYVTTDLAREMFENIVQQPLGFFEMRGSGDVVGRFTNDVFMVNQGLVGVFVRMLREPFKFFFFLISALIVDWKLTLLGLIVLPPLFYCLTWLGRKVRRYARRSLEGVASVASVVNETTRGMPIVAGFRMEEHQKNRANKELSKLRRSLRKVAKASAAMPPTSEFIIVGGLIFFVLRGAQKVDDNLITPGDLLILYGALIMMLDPIRKLAALNQLIQNSVAAATRVFEFIDAEPEIEEAAAPVTLPPLQKILRFENVHFAYNGGEDVLKGVNLDIHQGEVVALVGFSGSGKTTLAKLIPRFYDVTEGSISIDGQDIREASFASLRDQISVVTQDTVLFAESVRLNVTYGREDFSEEQIQTATHAAHAHEFIEQMPQGYDTILGESGIGLSGGQRQRIAIARAVMKNPSLLILDEATSSLDSESEHHIQQALEEFVAGRTAVIIAHRLSTIQRADRIVVLNEGQIAEEGTHLELLEKGGLYRRLYDTQFSMMEEAQDA